MSPPALYLLFPGQGCSSSDRRPRVLCSGLCSDSGSAPDRPCTLPALPTHTPALPCLRPYSTVRCLGPRVRLCCVTTVFLSRARCCSEHTDGARRCWASSPTRSLMQREPSRRRHSLWGWRWRGRRGRPGTEGHCSSATQLSEGSRQRRGLACRMLRALKAGGADLSKETTQ